MPDDASRAPVRVPSGVQPPPPPAPRWDPGARYRPSQLAGTARGGTPVRVPSGVQPPPPPAPRWDPGARYRPSQLARTSRTGTPVGAGVQPLTGAPVLRRLPRRALRGPDRRTAVLDREARATAISGAAERYRRGLLDTTGLGRAVGHVLAG